MINVDKLYQKPKIFQRLTGLAPFKFQELLQKLEPLFKEAETKRKYRPHQIRKQGGGRKLALSLGQSLFILLLYYRTYTNHVFIGMVAGMDDSNVCRYFRRIEPLLAQIFRIPQRKIDMSEEEILELIIDATEQESERRKGSGYSGKKKKNTIKTQIMVTPGAQSNQ
ncbi:transposase [Patescibacteria group bacterium AH-259-L07]|nr:transposase [Patescibacteria group bacterium AH-259-L07]